MRRKNKLFLFGFVIVALAITLLISFNYEEVNNFVNREIGNYGYIGIFVSSVLIDMIVQPLGPEVPGFVALVFGFNFWIVFLVISIGSVLGSLFSYYIGRKFLSRRIVDACHTKKYEDYCKFFHKYGRASLLISALSPVPYVFLCWLSGAFYMKLKDFTLYGLVPRIIRIGIVLVFIWGVL